MSAAQWKARRMVTGKAHAVQDEYRRALAAIAAADALADACRDAAATLADVIQYKSEHLVQKHGDADALVEFRAAIAAYRAARGGK